MEGSSRPESVICWLLVLSARWSQAPTTAQRRVVPPQGRAGLQRGWKYQHGAGRAGEEGATCIRCCNLILKTEREGSHFSQRFMIAPMLKCSFSGILFCTLLLHLKQMTLISMLNFDFIPETSVVSMHHTDIRMLEKVSEDHLYQSQYSGSRTRSSFFVEPHIVGHIIAIVVHVKPLISGIVVQVYKFLLEFLKGNTHVFLLSGLGVI